MYEVTYVKVKENVYIFKNGTLKKKNAY